jgi:hypothetical protein
VFAASIAMLGFIPLLPTDLDRQLITIRLISLHSGFPAAKVRDMTSDNSHFETQRATAGTMQSLALCFCVTRRFRDPAISEAIQA